MCGILVTSHVDRPFHHRALQSLRKRGPDDVGFWTNGRVHLAQTRLAIIGLDERSSQPMENDRHVLAYNGEIYNFLEINKRLANEGVHLAPANDAEVLLHAWSRWGKDILTAFTGFWAFAIYDKQRHSLILGRDQLGIKPLYYSITPSGVCVASMLRTILDVGTTPVELDYLALSEYARYQFTFGDRTFIKSIKKVLPGHILEIDLDTLEIKSDCYEDLLACEDDDFDAYTPSWLEETQALLHECVLESTISDTAITCFCSGGVDSSLITSIVQPELAYHCNFSDPDCNETFFAQQVTANLPTRLFVINAQEEFNLVDKLRSIIEDFDELTIGSVILPLDDLLSQVKRRFKVFLTGTGGDELFGGYVRYMLALGECNQDNYRALFQKVSKESEPWKRFEMCHTKGTTSLYRFYDSAAQDNFRLAFAGCGGDNGGNITKAMLRFDQRYFLSGLLNIDDKMCGRHSLEGRPSLLNQRLVRRMRRLEPSAFLRDGQLKPVLRDLAGKWLPRSVLYRKDKMGFTTPIGSFVNNCAHEIREQITNSPFRDLYDLKTVNFTAETKYSREVFGLLLLDLWLNRYAAR